MVRIVTDSPGGLTLEQAAAYDIVGVVPSYVIFGDHSWLEHQTITPAEFHEKLKTDPHFSHHLCAIHWRLHSGV